MVVLISLMIFLPSRMMLFDGCVFTFFWYLVSIIYGTWYLVLWFWLMVIRKGYVLRADGGRRKWWRRYCSRQTFATLFADHRSAPLRLAASLAAAGLSGGCRSIWRQVWPLQGRLAASLAIAGPLQGRYTRPSFNDAAAVEYSLCYLRVLLLLF